MFITPGLTRTPITLLGRGATLGGGEVIVDEVAVVGSDVASVDGIDGGGVQASVVGPALLA